MPVRARANPLLALVERLRDHYGPPAPPLSRDPFELVLWEQVAYLVDDARRLRAFRRLEDEVGLTPEAILAAPRARLAAIAAAGGSIASVARGARIRRSAELVQERWSGDLRAALKLPPRDAVRALACFPMIGHPGAKKILLFARAHRSLPLDSNGVRTLARFGLGEEGPSYVATYRSVEGAIEGKWKPEFGWLIDAHQLLRRHGQETCRRRSPGCPACPLLPECRFARSLPHAAG